LKGNKNFNNIFETKKLKGVAKSTIFGLREGVELIQQVLYFPGVYRSFYFASSSSLMPLKA